MLRTLFFSIITVAFLWLLLGVCTVEPQAPRQATKIKWTTTSTVDTQRVYKLAEIMPLYKKCDPPTDDKRENRSCSQTAILDYIQARIRIQPQWGCFVGRVIVQFIVNKDGTVSDAKVVRSLRIDELDEQIIGHFNNMPQWEQVGQQNNQAVKVYYVVPVEIGKYY